MTPWLTILHRWYCVCVLMHTNASDFPLRWLVYSVVSIWWSTLRAASQRDNFACPNFGVVPYSKHGTGWCLVFVSLQLVSSVHAFFSSLFGLLSTYNWREIKKTIEMKTSYVLEWDFYGNWVLMVRPRSDRTLQLLRIESERELYGASYFIWGTN